MKRFALLFAACVFAIPITGCGGGPVAGPGASDANLPSEVKDYEARRESERAKKALPGDAETRAAAKRAASPEGSLGEPGAR
jgi:hypothetical protein